MSDDNPTQTGDLGEMPEAETEPREPNPGGADALPEDEDNVPADLDPDDNPAVRESPDPLKAVLAEGEETDTESTKSSDGSDDVAPEDDSPA
jgi:hypothetical protein